METIKKAGVFSVNLYDKQDFFKDLENINVQMASVLSSYENNTNFNFEDAGQQLADLNTDLIVNDFLNVKLYVLYSNLENRPVGFALFTHDEERNDWHVEFICTHADFAGEGLGEGLLKIACQDLSKTDFKEVSSIVNKTNTSSIAMHRTFINSSNIRGYEEDLDEDRLLFQYDISNLQKAEKADEDGLIY